MQDTTTAPDQYTGHGGSYQLDPTTGQRTLLQRTDHQATPPLETENTILADTSAGQPASDQLQE